MISALYQNRIPASFLPKTSPSAKKTFLSEEGWHGEATTEGVRGVNLNRRSHPQRRPPSSRDVFQRYRQWRIMTMENAEGWHGEAATEGVRPPKRPPSAKKTSLFEGGGTAKP